MPKTLYVSPDGSDTNDGLTPGASLKTITRAVALVEPGDTIVPAAGTYPEAVRIFVPRVSILPELGPDTFTLPTVGNQRAHRRPLVRIVAPAGALEALRYDLSALPVDQQAGGVIRGLHLTGESRAKAASIFGKIKAALEQVK